MLNRAQENVIWTWTWLHQDKLLSFGKEMQASPFVLLKNYKQVKYFVLLTSKFPPLNNSSIEQFVNE